MQIKPVAGRIVRDPVKGELLPESGMTVPDNDPFWRRRLRDGDVELITKETVKSASKIKAGDK